MIKLSFNYSLKSEIERVEDTFRSKDFYIENGYQVFLPAGYTLDSFDLSGIKDRVAKEMSKDKVSVIENNIKKNWTRHQPAVDSFLSQLPYEKPKGLLVTLTQYGSGGSYWLPNEIVININYDNNYFETVVHELIHLIIEKPVIEKFDIGHWQKESLVDYLFINNERVKRIFPDYRYQNGEPSEELLEKIGWG